MGFLFTIASIAIALIIMNFMKFNSFKGQLFAALNAFGVPKQVSDDIYTLKDDEINYLHLVKGLSASQIARLIIDDKI